MGHPMARARVRNPLADPVRVAMLRGTGLLGTTPEEAFDRLAGLARKVLKAPDRDGHAARRPPPARQEPASGRRDLAKTGRMPVKETFCQHVVASGSRSSSRTRASTS